MHIQIQNRPIVAAGVAIAVLSILTGCGTSSSPTQTSPPAASTPAASTPAASEKACDDVEELQSSLEDLTKVKPAEDGVDDLRAAIDEVKTDLTAAETSVSDALRPSVDQVKVAFGELQTAAAGLTPENRREKAPQISAAMDNVRTTTQSLATTLRERCPRR